MIRPDRIDQAGAQAFPEPLAVLPLPDRRCALVTGVAVRNLLGGECQVMGTGLDGESQPKVAGTGDHRQGVGRRQVDDVDRTAKLAARSIKSRIASCSQARGRDARWRA